MFVPWFASCRVISRLFYDCDQAQADPVVAIAREQSSVYLQLLMHETQPPSQFTVSTITRYLPVTSALVEDQDPREEDAFEI